MRHFNSISKHTVRAHTVEMYTAGLIIPFVDHLFIMIIRKIAIGYEDEGLLSIENDLFKYLTYIYRVKSLNTQKFVVLVQD